ncbi:MAG TPA: endolytic transglycosylase MltG [Myxococcales bacterium]|nr:endolytic transglycosylase MltG [Myxococcales bacterium]
MKRLWSFFGVLIFLAAMGGGSYLYFDHKMSSPLDSGNTRVEITIAKGTTFDGAVEILNENGMAPHPLMFQTRARLRNRRVPLQAGLYRFKRSMSPDQIMDKLVAGPDMLLKDLPLKFQITPGQNLFQIANHLTRIRARGNLFKIAASPAKIQALGAPLPARLRAGAHTALEGYLYPDTYFLERKKPRVMDVVKRAVKRFNQVWQALKEKHAGRLNAIRSELALSDHDLVTLASLIEKEMGHKDEAAQIAGVFYNRLRNGQRLQTDPTLVYGPDSWRQKPSPAHRMDRRNPYNTYHIPGLPPGPIASPGKAALEAVLTPARTQAYYFVAKRDGSGRHVFSKTLAEHRANINRYLR